MTRFSLELSRLGVSYAAWDVMCWWFMREMHMDVADLLRSFGDCE